MKLSLPFVIGVLLSLGCSYVQAAYTDPYAITPADIPDTKPTVIRSKGAVAMMQDCKKNKPDNDNAVYVSNGRYEFDQRTLTGYCIKGKLKRVKLPQGYCGASTQPQKQSDTRHLWTHCNGDNHRVELEVCDADKKHENCQTVPWYSTEVKPGSAPGSGTGNPNLPSWATKGNNAEVLGISS